MERRRITGRNTKLTRIAVLQPVYFEGPAALTTSARAERPAETPATKIQAFALSLNRLHFVIPEMRQHYPGSCQAPAKAFWTVRTTPLAFPGIPWVRENSTGFRGGRTRFAVHLEATPETVRELLENASGDGPFEQDPSMILASLDHCESLPPKLDRVLDNLTGCAGTGT
jgi:hypothetical protein